MREHAGLFSFLRPGAATARMVDQRDRLRSADEARWTNARGHRWRSVFCGSGGRLCRAVGSSPSPDGGREPPPASRRRKRVARVLWGNTQRGPRSPGGRSGPRRLPPRGAGRAGRVSRAKAGVRRGGAGSVRGICGGARGGDSAGEVDRNGAARSERSAGHGDGLRNDAGRGCGDTGAARAVSEPPDPHHEGQTAPQAGGLGAASVDPRHAVSVRLVHRDLRSVAEVEAVEPSVAPIEADGAEQVERDAPDGGRSEEPS